MKDSRPTFPFGWFSALMLLDVGVLLVEKTASTDARGDGIALVLSFLSQPWVWLILVMKLAQLRTWSVLLSRMDLSLAFPLTALAIPITMGAAVVLFGEHLEWPRLARQCADYGGRHGDRAGRNRRGEGGCRRKNGSTTGGRMMRSNIFWGATLACAMRMSVAMAQTDGHLILDDWTASKHFESDTSVLSFGHSRTDAGGSTQFLEILSQGRLRLDATMPLSPSVGYDWTHLELSPSATLPGRLDDLSIAIGSPLFSQGAWFGGATIGLGYAGDAAFGGSTAFYAKASAFVGKDLGEGKSLIFMLDYDGNRTFLPDVPLPSIEYDIKFDQTLEIAIGLPTSAITWHPDPKWTLSAEYDFPNTVLAEVDYQVLPTFAVFGKFVSDEVAFHVDSLPGDRRLFYSSERFELGVDWTIQDDVKLNAAVGYATGRRFSTGFDDRSLHHAADLQDQMYLRFGVEFSF